MLYVEVVLLIFICIIMIVLAIMAPNIIIPMGTAIITIATIKTLISDVINADKSIFHSLENLISTKETAPEEKKEEPSEIKRQSLYDDYYEKWDSYRFLPDRDTTNLIYRDCNEGDNSCDKLITDMSRHRARDKKCIDGHITKDSDFYKYHFADELSEVEDKPWWGRNEY